MDSERDSLMRFFVCVFFNKQLLLTTLLISVSIFFAFWLSPSRFRWFLGASTDSCMVVLPTCGLSTTRIVQHGWTTLRIVHCNVYPPERIYHFSNGLTTESHQLFRLISGGQTVSPQWTPGQVKKWSKCSKKCLKRDSNARPPGHQSPMLTIRPWRFGCDDPSASMF